MEPVLMRKTIHGYYIHGYYFLAGLAPEARTHPEPAAGRPPARKTARTTD
ncbi:hypothetical protein GCM10010378_41290 [Streptomyces viridochromogenes]